jgi:hypothetical protein
MDVLRALVFALFVVVLGCGGMALLIYVFVYLRTYRDLRHDRERLVLPTLALDSTGGTEGRRYFGQGRGKKAGSKLC